MFTKTASLIALPIRLSSCTGFSGVVGKHLNAYDGPELSDHQVATIIEYQQRPFSIRSFVQEVDGVAYGGPFAGYPQIVKVLPETRSIAAHCTSGTAYASPSTTIDLKAGKTYEIICRYTGENRLSVTIQETHQFAY